MDKTSVQQRKMKHAEYRSIADELVSHDIDMREFLSKMSRDIPMTWETVKHIEKTIIKQEWGLDSTNDLSNGQINALKDYWIKNLGENWGIETHYEQYETIKSIK
jgi:hypothetical protein